MEIDRGVYFLSCCQVKLNKQMINTLNFDFPTYLMNTYNYNKDNGLARLRRRLCIIAHEPCIASLDSLAFFLDAGIRSIITNCDDQGEMLPKWLSAEVNGKACLKR